MNFSIILTQNKVDMFNLILLIYLQIICTSFNSLIPRLSRTPKYEAIDLAAIFQCCSIIYQYYVLICRHYLNSIHSF